MKIALTFDDGPNFKTTDMLLDLLGKHAIKATFFMIGKFVVDHREIVARVAEAGHLIGNHTYNHPKLTECTGEEVFQEIWLCENALSMFVGKHSMLFRPPFMLTSGFIEKTVIDYGLRTIAYHAAAGDGMQRGADFHFEKVKKELADKDGIVLLHDGCHSEFGAYRGDTIGTVAKIIEHYKDAEFVSPLEIA